MHPVVRVISAVGGLLMMDPGSLTDIIGIALLVGVFVWQKVKEKKSLKTA